MNHRNTLKRFEQLQAQIEGLLVEMRLLLECPRNDPSLCSQARDWLQKQWDRGDAGEKDIRDLSYSEFIRLSGIYISGPVFSRCRKEVLTKAGYVRVSRSWGDWQPRKEDL